MDRRALVGGSPGLRASGFLTRLVRHIPFAHAATGRSGGFRLSRPANEIRIVDVVTPFEPAGTAPTCILGRASCQDALPCAAHHGWRELGKARDQYLRDTTIADLAS